MTKDKLINGIPKATHVRKWMKFFSQQFSPQFANTENINNKYLDIPYTVNENGPALDLYLPSEPQGAPFPVIIFIHGGGWLLGDKRTVLIEPLFYLLKKGYAFISINYSLSSAVEFPTPVHEVKTAVRWLRAHAGEYNLDPERIVLWGASAGGHLAALAGTTADKETLDDPSLGWEKQSCRVEAVVDWFAPINILDMWERNKGLSMVEDAASMETLFFGDDPPNIPQKIREGSPDTHIDPHTPPIIIQHGDQDDAVPAQQSINFASKLEKVIGKDKVILEILKGAGHEDERFYSKENLDKIVGYLEKYLSS